MVTELEIKAVLFDMFDTLMMIEHDHEFYIPSIKMMYNTLINKGINVSFDDFKNAYTKARNELYKKADLKNEEPHFNERIAKALLFLGYKYSKNSSIVIECTLAFCKEFMKYVRIDKDTKKVLTELYKKYKLGIVSNFAIPECVINLLKREDIEKFFSIIIVSGAVNKRKPNEEIFKTALNSLKVTGSETVFVGDTLDADIRGANDLGMTTIFIERRVQKEKNFIIPDINVKTLKELLFWIK